MTSFASAKEPINRFVLHTSFPGDHRELEPPDPLPNSVVKWFIADGSVGFPHVRVGHRQDSKKENPSCASSWGFVFFGCGYLMPLLSGSCETLCTAGTRCWTPQAPQRGCEQRSQFIVGHRQDSKKENPSCASSWGFLLSRSKRHRRSGHSRRISEAGRRGLGLCQHDEIPPLRSG